MDLLVQQMNNGELTAITIVLWVVLAGLVGAVGGCIGASVLGGKHLGKELVIMMGAPFGALAAAPGVLLALLLLKLV